MSEVVMCSFAALVIAALYYAWRDLYHVFVERRRTRRERVAYMLWTAAKRVH